ncbi:EAL domain-containing protein [Dechloromonas denitrificans]|uniref:EAL domain-containing protein n=1 Tax=Dechloromonas denitrificans TaxID=281362 RepID=UPI001CF87AC7|nr:EAL domain-containing protein [Dechloromonas denitrificans]UCV11493.1 EAL domain-containing protein [Dechloromonas denitrificans]
MPRIVDLITPHTAQVALHASLGEAAALMVELRISSVIVVDTDGVHGIVTEGDMMQAMRQHRTLDQAVREVMTAPVHTVPAEMDFRHAYREASQLGIRHLVVIDTDGKPLGIASETDFRHHLGPDFFRHLNDVDTLMERTFPRLPATTRLDDAISAMAAVRATCVVVVDGRKPLGIVTERDVVRLFLGANFNPELGSVMTQPVVTVEETSSLADAAERMVEHRIRHLVIVDRSGQVSGLLSEHTLMRPLELDLLDDAMAERMALMRSRDAAVEQSLRNERYQRALLDNFPFLVWLKDTESRFLTANRALADALELDSVNALIGKRDTDFSPAELADRYRADDAEVMQTRQQKTVLEPVIKHGLQIWHETFKAPVFGDNGTLLGTVGFAQDISARKRSDEAMLLRNATLAGLIRGEPLIGILELLILSIEAENPAWMCSILLAEKDGQHLYHGASPRLPDDYIAATGRIPVADGVGSCSTAAYRRQQTIVSNVHNDPLWQPCLHLAQLGGFSACWSDPIIGPQGELLGTFACYQKNPATPSEQDLNQLNQASQLAALVLTNQRNTDNLQESLETFRGIFDSISEAIFIQAEDGCFLDANLGAERLSGHTRDYLLGKHYSEFGATGLNDPEVMKAQVSEAFAGRPRLLEFWGQNAAGKIFPVEAHLHAGTYFGRKALIISIQDISERKNAKLRLDIEHDLALALAAGMAREEVLATILHAALRFPELDSGGIYWRQPNGRYHLFAHEGLSPEFIAQVGEIAGDSPQAGIVQDGKPVCNCTPACEHCNNTELINSPLMQDEGLRCLVILPIAVAGQPVACLNLAGHRTRQITHATLLALETLAGNFSQTLSRLQAQEEAQRLQQNLNGLFDTLADYIFIFDMQGHILHYNRSVAENLGYGPDALRGQPVTAVHPAKAHEMAGKMVEEMISGTRSTCTLPILHVDGHEIMVETRITQGYWNSQPALFGISQNISERLAAEERQKLAASVFDNAHEGIMITDARGQIIEVNATFSELTGYARDEAIGQTADLLKSGHHDPVFYQEMWQTIRQEGFWRGEVWNRKKTGEIFVEQLTISTVRNRNGEISQFVGIFSDITLIKEHQRRLEHQAHFDALTQLPNRMLLGDRMQLAMAQTERSGKTLAVCYLDLDNFKPVNDAYGHATGDRLLIEVAQRLKICVRAGDTVSRLGGDEFVLLLAGLEDVHECDHAIARIIAALTQPFIISNHAVTISASIGVTLYPEDGADSDTLLRHADQAMYAAKQAGRNRYHLFDPENDRRARVRRDEIAAICQGMVNNEFVLHYQPKVNMREGRVVGVEALIRWQHPERGLLAPGQFLPAIEGSELAIELGDWVIQEALRQLERWRKQSLDIKVSVNIAGNHLQSPSFARRLSELLAAHPNIQPHRLELEVLETAALEDIGHAAELFATCRRLGVSFSLDDFGTGYSSLTYFRRLPADVLKIDQSFVRDMLDDPDDLAIVEGVIGLTKAFQREVIAEGVETVEHGLVLLLLGCDLAQGFGIARPMPAEQLPDWVRQFQPDVLWSSATAFRWSRDDLPLLIAEVDHKRWIRSLHVYLASPNGPHTAPPKDPFHCRFGRWFYSEESKRYAAVDCFASIESIHNRIHELGQALIALHDAQSNEGKDELLLELDAASAQFVEYIEQIQAEVLIGDQTSRR